MESPTTTPTTPSSLAAALSYTDRGGGGAVPLVLLHGFPLDRRMWDGQIERLSEHRRVIAPDLRGFGQSRRSDPFTIESLADDVHVFLDQLVALPCVLAGLSMGGYVALAYAKKYPSDLRGLVLIDTKAEADTPDGKAAREKMIQLVRASGAAAVAEQMMPKMIAPAALESRPDVVKTLRQIMENCPPGTIEYALKAMRDRPDRTGELPSIKCPTLVIVGDADAITPPDVADAMSKAIPSARLETIRGAGHMSPMEQPEQVNRAIERFMAAL
jgi:pimeloyl-ACP methyl ester carboxylesterase